MLSNFIQSCFIYFRTLFVDRLIIMHFSLHNIIHHFIWCHLFCFIKPITSRLDLTLCSADDKGLQVETSCIIYILNYCYVCCSGTILLLIMPCLRKDWASRKGYKAKVTVQAGVQPHFSKGRWGVGAFGKGGHHRPHTVCNLASSFLSQ